MKLNVRDVSKRFGVVRALEGVDVDFESGAIHAVLGENGAGKSTLMNVLGGFVRPDAGEVLLDGEPLPLGDPLGCRKRGVEMVHQHFMLVPAFTVAENLALARLGRLAGTLDLLETVEPSLLLARHLGWSVDSSARTEDLSVGDQQRIEILKALAGDAPVLIFDEPTAVLTPSEVDDLFRVLGDLRASGKTIILIAHKLDEVMRIADRVTVLRKGRKVADAEIGDVDPQTLARWMVGDLPQPPKRQPRPEGGPALTVRDLAVRGDRGQNAVQGVTFEVARGEVLGIGGVDGNGQVELAETLAGVRGWQSGDMTWEGTNRLPVAAYIPQDRQAEGLALGMTVMENLLVGGGPAARGPFLRPGAIRAWAKGLVARYDIRTPSLDIPVGSLSGGNQQKVVVARALDRAPDLLVAVNPTRGLDIQAADTVHQVILGAAEAGCAVILFSTDLDELAVLATRTLFMSRGRLVERMESALQ